MLFVKNPAKISLGGVLLNSVTYSAGVVSVVEVPSVSVSVTVVVSGTTGVGVTGVVVSSIYFI